MASPPPITATRISCLPRGSGRRSFRAPRARTPPTAATTTIRPARATPATRSLRPHCFPSTRGKAFARSSSTVTSVLAAVRVMASRSRLCGGQERELAHVLGNPRARARRLETAGHGAKILPEILSNLRKIRRKLRADFARRGLRTAPPSDGRVGVPAVAPRGDRRGRFTQAQREPVREVRERGPIGVFVIARGVGIAAGHFRDESKGQPGEETVPRVQQSSGDRKDGPRLEAGLIEEARHRLAHLAPGCWRLPRGRQADGKEGRRSPSRGVPVRVNEL